MPVPWLNAEEPGVTQRTLIPVLGVVAVTGVLVGCLWPSEPSPAAHSAPVVAMSARTPDSISQTHQLPDVPNGALEVHASQKRIDGPCFFIEISQGRFVKPENPRGWAHPFYNELPQKGWSILLGTMMQASQAGYTSVWLWEPSGQSPDGGGCMAWFGRKTVDDGWSDKMKESFPGFAKTVRERLGMELILYSGCAQSINVGTTKLASRKDTSDTEIPDVVDAARYAIELGASGLGFDAFSLLQEKNPNTAKKIINAIRSDAVAKDIILACEGWPFPTESQGYIQQHMISVDMLRGGTSVEPDNFAKFFQRVNNQREKQRVPGRVGVFLLHGSNWNESQVAKAYSLAKQHGMLPMDYRMDGPRKYWRP